MDEHGPGRQEGACGPEEAHPHGPDDGGPVYGFAHEVEPGAELVGQQVGVEDTAQTEGGDELEERGISVRRDVLREEAADVLREYAALGGEIYNSRRDDTS